MEKLAYTLFILITIILSIITTTICSTTDQESLIAFKTTITSDPFEILSKNWSVHTSICTWIGVSCSLNPQRVTTLNLPAFEFEGTIPPTIGNLTFLTSLDLSNNKFTGSIPSEIFNLSSIEKVDLTNNSLIGVLPNDMCSSFSRLSELHLSFNLLSGQIPFDIYKCSEIIELSLSNNHFNGSIPSSIGWLNKLEKLHVGVNNLQGGVASSIRNLSRLRELSMRGAYLTGEIPSFVFNMSSLRSIDLGNNSLSGSLSMTMYHNLPNLEQLFLDSNQLSGKVLEQMLDFKSLWVLSLSNNKFTGQIAKRVGNLTSLEYLFLDNNNFTGELPSELGNLNLVKINVHNNSLSGGIPGSIFNISTVTMLELSSNKFSGQLPSTFGVSLPSLQELYLSETFLTGRIPSSINNASSLTLIAMTTNSFYGPIPNLDNLSLLRGLYLAENNLTAESPNKELTFLTSLTRCRNLQTMEVSLNQLNGLLPPSIGNFSDSFLVFRAFGCGIRGSIPEEIGNSTSLRDLYLDSNELSGSIPTTLGKLKGVIRIYLEYNKLQGLIPNELCLLSNLGHIYLSHNKLQGKIPDCFSDFKYMKALYLDSNNLDSDVPADLWSLYDILELNLSTNSLTGPFPSGIDKLKVIEKLDLSCNNFSGDVPTQIERAESLVYLSLAHNEFQDSIPESIGRLKGLEFLDLSFNSFSGFIPSSLEGLTYLKEFNVSYNKLQGKIPTGGVFVNFSDESFLKNDGLCGDDQTRRKVPRCGKSSSVNVVSLLKFIIPSLLLVMIIVIAILVLMRRRKRTQELPDDAMSLVHSWRGSSYMELVGATDDFNESNKLGSGGTGSVFKGIFSDGLVVAIKVFDLQSEHLNRSYSTEVEVLRAVRHRNLIKIIGFCSKRDFKALVLEYMPNGSLDKWLHSDNLFLDLSQRLNIVMDVALALEYLHVEYSIPIVHCDLKPSNVLLDEDMTAHVGDFGMSKLFGEGELMAHTRTLATVGYMAPEYGAQGIVSTSGDIYSFGIMLLEICTRKRPTDERFSGEISLKSWVSLSLQENKIREVVDKDLVETEAKEQCLSSMLSLAMECLANSASDRINITEVVPKLEKIRTMYLSSYSTKVKSVSF